MRAGGIVTDDVHVGKWLLDPNPLAGGHLAGVQNLPEDTGDRQEIRTSDRLN